MSTRTEFNTGIWANEEKTSFAAWRCTAVATGTPSGRSSALAASSRSEPMPSNTLRKMNLLVLSSRQHLSKATMLAVPLSPPLPPPHCPGVAAAVVPALFDWACSTVQPATGSRSRSHSSSSSSSSRSSSNSNDSFRYCRFTWEPVSHLIANHTPAAHPEELHGDNNGTHIDPSLTVDVPGGVLPPVVDTDAHGGQHPQAFINLAGNQAGEPMVGLASHHNNGSGDYSPPVIWEQASLRGKTRRYVRIDDVCGIL